MYVNISQFSFNQKSLETGTNGEGFSENRTIQPKTPENPELKSNGTEVCRIIFSKNWVYLRRLSSFPEITQNRNFSIQCKFFWPRSRRRVFINGLFYFRICHLSVDKY